MKNLTPVSFDNVDITEGFWRARQDINASVTVHAVHEQFSKTGRFDALKHEWREGAPHKPHIFWDSDVAKWIEAAAYILHKHKNDALEATVDAYVEHIEHNRHPSGYFNSYFQSVEPQNRWTRRADHELYCAGHLLEAATAYHKATGKRRLLDVMLRYMEHIYTVFVTERSAAFETPGHEEIELALIKLYKHTGERKWLELSRHFITKRGTNPDDHCFNGWFNEAYGQDNATVDKLEEAEGHAVRFFYLYAAVADLARETGDKSLLDACKRLWRDIVDKKMYVTGGVGSMKHGEAFGPAYYLPNAEAYAETCASIAMIYFGHRLLRMEPRGEYADVCELQLYNGALAGVSLDGRGFFYENPLEHRHGDHKYFIATKASYRPAQRVEVFSCSCCPPNILRLMASIGDYVYMTDGNTCFVNHYMSGTAEVHLGGAHIRVTQRTDYPWDGRVNVTLNVDAPVKATLAVRLPGWCDDPSVSLDGTAHDGYYYIERQWQDGDVIQLDFPMKVTEKYANPLARANAGRVALMRGPLVYCLEQEDNAGVDVVIPADASYECEWQPELLSGVCAVTFDALRQEPAHGLYTKQAPSYERVKAMAVPYYAWANRSAGDMCVWARKEA